MTSSGGRPRTPAALFTWLLASLDGGGPALLGWSAMALARAAVLAVLTAALAAYGLDCAGMTTPEQAMQCCNSMQCASHGHRGQGCCKTMPSMRAVLGQPSSAQGIAPAPVALGAVQPCVDPEHGISSSCMIAERSHDPPLRSPDVLPLRV